MRPGVYGRLEGRALLQKNKLITCTVASNGESVPWKPSPSAANARFLDDVICCTREPLPIRCVGNRVQLPNIVFRLNFTAVGSKHRASIRWRKGGTDFSLSGKDEGLSEVERHLERPNV